MRVGLTGGIGSGKSAVAEILAELGAFVIDTDELAREAVAPGSPALFEISRKWPQVFRNGALDRGALADLVFSDDAARAQLNAIVHPRVRALAAEREKAARPHQLLVHVVPLLFETGYGDTLDRSIVVVASDANRIARVTERDRVDESARSGANGGADRAREGAVAGGLRHRKRRGPSASANADAPGLRCARSLASDWARATPSHRRASGTGRRRTDWPCGRTSPFVPFRNARPCPRSPARGPSPRAYGPGNIPS